MKIITYYYTRLNTIKYSFFKALLNSINELLMFFPLILFTRLHKIFFYKKYNANKG